MTTMKSGRTANAMGGRCFALIAVDDLQPDRMRRRSLRARARSRPRLSPSTGAVCSIAFALPARPRFGAREPPKPKPQRDQPRR